MRAFPFARDGSVAAYAILWSFAVTILPLYFMLFSEPRLTGLARAGAFFMVTAGFLGVVFTFLSPAARKLHKTAWLELFRTQAVFLATLGGAAFLLAYQVLDFDIVKEAADPGAAWMGQDVTGAGLAGLFQLVAGAVIPVLNAHIAASRQSTSAES